MVGTAGCRVPPASARDDDVPSCHTWDSQRGFDRSNDPQPRASLCSAAVENSRGEALLDRSSLSWSLQCPAAWQFDRLDSSAAQERSCDFWKLAESSDLTLVTGRAGQNQ